MSDAEKEVRFSFSKVIRRPKPLMEIYRQTASRFMALDAEMGRAKHRWRLDVQAKWLCPATNLATYVALKGIEASMEDLAVSHAKTLQPCEAPGLRVKFVNRASGAEKMFAEMEFKPEGISVVLEGEEEVSFYGYNELGKFQRDMKTAIIVADATETMTLPGILSNPYFSGPAV
jgi:hypothetical protein